MPTQREETTELPTWIEVTYEAIDAVKPHAIVRYRGRLFFFETVANVSYGEEEDGSDDLINCYYRHKTMDQDTPLYHVAAVDVEPALGGRDGTVDFN